MAEVLIILAHPALQHSRINRAMIEAVAPEPAVRIHDLYEMYPDFNINIRHEKQALIHAGAVIFQHPMQWYSCPALMKEWIDIVLQKGWAYGDGGKALKGKKWLSVISAGGPREVYGPEGYNRFTTDELLRPFEQTAYLCGMKFKPPIVFHDALKTDEAAIARHIKTYRAAIRKLTGGHSGE